MFGSTQCRGSGIQFFPLDPGWKKIWILDPGTRINVSDHISKAL
jgi:hypothetical protein